MLPLQARSRGGTCFLPLLRRGGRGLGLKNKNATFSSKRSKGGEEELEAIASKRLIIKMLRWKGKGKTKIFFLSFLKNPTLRCEAKARVHLKKIFACSL
jgi:hypothetical protein